MFKPLFALHKNGSAVLGAGSFKHEWDLSTWLRSLDVRAGDVIEFGETAQRAESDEAEPPAPAFLTDPTPTDVIQVSATAVATATATSDKPF